MTHLKIAPLFWVDPARYLTWLSNVLEADELWFDVFDESSFNETSSPTGASPTRFGALHPAWSLGENSDVDRADVRGRLSDE